MEKPPIIIAMKGHPGTGKSTIASVIAATLRCPLLDKDDIRDATLSLSSTASTTTSTTTTTASTITAAASTASTAVPSAATATTFSATELNHLSYDAVWRVAATQIRLGLSVVVDSPLSHRGHLDNVLRIAGGSHRVVIIECRPSDEGEWRRRLEVRGAEDGGVGHRPATWQDMERLLEGYDGCTEYDVGEVPKLVVDTTAPGGGDGVLSNVFEFIEAHRGHPQS